MKGTPIQTEIPKNSPNAQKNNSPNLPFISSQSLEDLCAIDQRSTVYGLNIFWMIWQCRHLPESFWIHMPAFWNAIVTWIVSWKTLNQMIFENWFMIWCLSGPGDLYFGHGLDYLDLLDRWHWGLICAARPWLSHVEPLFSLVVLQLQPSLRSGFYKKGELVMNMKSIAAKHSGSGNSRPRHAKTKCWHKPTNFKCHRHKVLLLFLSARHLILQ